MKDMERRLIQIGFFQDAHFLLQLSLTSIEFSLDGAVGEKCSPSVFMMVDLPMTKQSTSETVKVFRFFLNHFVLMDIECDFLLPEYQGSLSRSI